MKENESTLREKVKKLETENVSLHEIINRLAAGVDAERAHLATVQREFTTEVARNTHQTTEELKARIAELEAGTPLLWNESAPPKSQIYDYFICIIQVDERLWLREVQVGGNGEYLDRDDEIQEHWILAWANWPEVPDKYRLRSNGKE